MTADSREVMIEGVLLAWGRRCAREDNPGLGYKIPPAARMIVSPGQSTVKVRTPEVPEQDVDRMCELVTELAGAKPRLAYALKARYEARGATERQLARWLGITRDQLQYRLKAARQWVAHRF